MKRFFKLLSNILTVKNVIRLKLENIGMIRHADIRLDGLTVIADEHDMGKIPSAKLFFL